MNDGAVDAFYRLHHLRLRLRAAPGPHAEHAHDALVYKGAQRVMRGTADAAPPDIEVQVLTAGGAIPVPPDAEPVVVHEHGLEVLHAPDGYYVRADWVAAHVEPEAARVAIAPLGPLPDDPGRAVFYLLIVALTPILQRLGLYGLHAAALVPDGGGDGLLIAAPSGSGKTTTTLTLVRHGWTPVSDDALLLRTGGGASGQAVEALAFRRDVCLRPEAAGPFPEILSRDWPRSPSDPTKWRVDVGEAFGAAVADACVPRLLLVPEITEAAESRLVPLERAASLQHLAACSAIRLSADPADTTRQLGVFYQLTAQARPYRFLAGRDVMDAPEQVVQGLQDVLRGGGSMS
jgi:hypothetical protein